MGDTSGEPTNTLLRAATYLKDNRLPPRGYQRLGPMASHTGIKGKAFADMNYNVIDDQEGSGTDIVTYDIDVTNAHYPLAIRAQLLYQSNSSRFINNLLQDDTPAVSRLRKMLLDTDNTPAVVDSITSNLDD